MKTCVRCSSDVPASAKFCSKCRGTTFNEIDNCPSCKAKLPKKDANFCPSCGKKLQMNVKIKMKQIHAPEGKRHKCMICISEVGYDLAVCPSCLHTFHFNHLANWILSNSNCPVCKVKLELLD